MKNTERFTGKADAYEQSRPDYPAEALACIARECNLAPGATVADIGAGTGKLTRALLAEGYNVVAVEPNPDMLATLRANFPGLRVIAAPAETTTLPDHSVDAITVAQAFHWFDHAACKIEFARVLKPGGRIALLWNHRDQTKPLTREHGALMLRHKVKNAVFLEHEHDVYAQFFSRYETFGFPHMQLLDEAALLSLTFSRSYSPKPGDSSYAALAQAVKALFAKHKQNGLVQYCYQTNIVIGDL